MAGRTITQRIQLVGGDEIKLQLEGIGRAGELAFTRLSAAANTGSVFSRFGSAIDTVRTKMSTVVAEASRVGNAVTRVGESIAAAGARIGIVAGVGIAGAATKLAQAARNAGESQEALDNNAAALGVGAKELDTFQKVAGLAGVGQESLQKALLKVNSAANEQVKADRTLSKAKQDLFRQFQRGEISYQAYSNALRKINEDANQGNDVFTRLGVNIRGADGQVKDSLTLFRELGDALGNVRNGTERSGLAMEVFGSRNAKLTKLSMMSAAEFRKQAEEIQRLTPALEDAEREGLANFGDRLELLGKVATTTRDKIFAVFAPSLTRLVDAVIERVAGARAGMLAIAQDLQAKLEPIITDIIAAIEGRDADVQNSSILKFRDAAVQGFQDVAAAVQLVVKGIGALKVVLDGIAISINTVFGTKLTGNELLAAGALLKLTGLMGVFRTVGSGLITVITALVAVFGGWTVAIAAAGFALGFFIVQSIQQLGGLQAIATRVLQGIPIIIGRVLQGIPILINQAVQGIVSLVQQIVSGIGSVLSGVVGLFTPVIAAVSAFAQSIITAIGNIPTQIGQLFSALGSLIAGVWAGIAETATTAWATITQLFTDGVNSIVSFFTSLPETLATLWANIVQAAQDAWNAIVEATKTLAQGIMDALKAGVDAAIGYVKDLYDQTIGFFNGIIEKAKAVASAVASAFSGGGGDGETIPGNAAGGYIQGRGTGTSDSILSWLSNGEFVMRAAAVKKWGVGLLSKMNNLQMPNIAGAVLPPIPKFASGGLVSAGMSGGGRPLTLQIGDQVISGLTANTGAVETLQRYAAQKAVRSAGRKPLWFQG
jgi:phage-related protein